MLCSAGPSLPPGVQGHPDPAAAYPAYPGFTLALVEEFDQPLDLDHDPVWTWSDGGLAEGAVRFVKDAIAFRAGELVLSARRENAPAGPSHAEPVPESPLGFVPDKPLKSGELRTRYNNYRWGRYEVRLQPPTADGNFISTLFLFRTPKFEQWREIDIELTADRPHALATNVISADGARLWSPAIQEFADQFPLGPDSRPLPAGFSHQGRFHTYAIEWLPERIMWLVDGVPVRVKWGGRLPVPEKSAKVMLNLWVFGAAGGFGGDPARNVYPLEARYDWFRFYRWDGEPHYPCAPLPECLPAEDRNLSRNNSEEG